MLKFVRNISSIITLTVILCVSFSVYPQKALLKKQSLEILTVENELSYQIENKRVSVESGAPVALYQLNYAVKPDTPEKMAQQYLKENEQLLKMSNIAGELQHTFTRETPGGFHVRYLQHLDGYPVYNSEVVVNLNKKNHVTFVMNSYKPLAKLDNPTPQILLKNASQMAKNYLNIQSKPVFESQETVVYYNNRKTRLAHKIQLAIIEEPRGDWEILIDAHTGEIFKVVNHVLNRKSDKKNTQNAAATGSGWVFDPDPLTRSGATYQTSGFGDNNDADSDSLTAQLVEVTLNDISFKTSDSLYHLEGPYAEVLDWDAPFRGEASQPSDTFYFTRSAPEFESVNVYYHIDKSMRYINETLGFELMPLEYNGGVKADPHGENGQDNSAYWPSLGRLTYGEGGVDDAEDLDVILHELGHGLHDWLANGGLSNVQGLSEGCGDYWAASYNRSLGFWTPSDQQYNWVYQWDGHNQFWAGRRVNYTAHYPDELVGIIHTDGQMWASTLMSIWDEIGRTATDLNFLTALAMTNSQSNQQDAAQAFIQADIDNYNGAHLSVIKFWFDQRGYSVNVPAPAITHTPLGDTEDLNGPYDVAAKVSATAPIAEVKLFYGTNGSITDTLDMILNSKIYSASIPGSGNFENYNYYIFALDSNGLAATHPSNAPAEFHTFKAEQDTFPPVISHSPLGNQAYIRWPASISASIVDNIGVSSARVEYSTNNGGPTGSFDLANTTGNNYFGTFDFDTTSVSVGDSISYRIIVEDASVSRNQSIVPQEGFYQFAVIQAAGIILVIDDDVANSKQINSSEKGPYTRDINKNPVGKSGNEIRQILNDAGYVTLIEGIQATDPTTWEQYDLIISSSGINEDPVADSSYRAALINWVSNPAHKLLIEGGEVGYDATTSPGYPEFATNVLHSSTWEDDNGGPLRLIDGFSDHPIVNTPHLLPDRMFIVYSAFPSQDMMNTINGAYTLYDSQNKDGYAGISIFDDNENIKSAQIVFYAFNYAEMFDSTNAQNLLKNTVNYLLASEIEPNIAPANFTLQTPATGDTVTSIDSIQFTWNNAFDADGDSLNYKLHVFDNVDDIRIENIQDTIYHLTNASLVPETEYRWTASVNDGQVTTASSDTFSFITPGVVGIGDFQNGLPASFALHQNYPNPFNPTTNIHYDLKESGSISLSIYNLLGQKVRTLVQANQTAGYKKVEWDGRNEFGELLGSGIYIYKLEVNAANHRFIQTRKMVLLK